MKGSHPKLFGFFLKCLLFPNSCLVTQADRYHHHLLFLTISCPFRGATPLASPGPHLPDNDAGLFPWLYQTLATQGKAWDAKDLPPKPSIFPRVWRRIPAGDFSSSQVVAAISLPSLGGLPGTAGRGQPISHAPGGDVGNETGRDGPAQERGVGRTPVPTPCPTAGPGCWYLTPARSSTRDPQKAPTNPRGCSTRTTCLCSLFRFVNVIIQKHIYIYISRNLSQMSRRWLCSGLARAVQAAAGDGEQAQRNPCPACRQAGRQGSRWAPLPLSPARLCRLDEGSQAATSVTQRFSSGSRRSERCSERTQP